MSFKCKIGFHSWEGCKCSKCSIIRDEQHNWGNDCEKCSKCGKSRKEIHSWEGCKCSRCGKTRDEQHSWEGCKCPQCGKTRDEQHPWEGCKCLRCGKSRDEQHLWNSCICSKCGKTRNEQHSWDGCICSKCSKTRNEQHIWDGCTCRKCKKIELKKIDVSDITYLHELEKNTIIRHTNMNFFDYHLLLELLKTIYNKSYFIINDYNRCGPCESDYSKIIELNLVKDSFYICPNCHRVLNKADFNFQNRNKLVILIGVLINENGGFKKMQELADELKKHGYRIRGLEFAWSGIGKWLA